MAKERETTKTLAQNKKARHDYFVEETIEAGIELSGTEVKSIRQGMLNLKDSYAAISRSGEVYLKGMHVSPYEKGNIFNRDPLRDRRLLLHKAQIRKIAAQTAQQGYSLVPLSVYLKGPRVKVALGVVRGKKLYDKRDDAAKRDAQRDIERAMKNR